MVNWMKNGYTSPWTVQTGKSTLAQNVHIPPNPSPPPNRHWTKQTSSSIPPSNLSTTQTHLNNQPTARLETTLEIKFNLQAQFQIVCLLREKSLWRGLCHIFSFSSPSWVNLIPSQNLFHILAAINTLSINVLVYLCLQSLCLHWVWFCVCPLSPENVDVLYTK